MSKFKIGDRVICNTDWEYGKKGDTATVIDINCCGYFDTYVKYDKDNKFYINQKMYVFEKYYDLLVEDKPKCKFKVGDIVIGNDDRRYGITKKGWIGKVTLIDKNAKEGYADIYVEDIGQPDFKTWVESKYFDLYAGEPTLTPVEVKQKVIDKIRKLFKEKK